MRQIQRCVKFLTDPGARMSYLATKGFYHNMSDEEYLRRLFKRKMGYELDLNNPKTFNEKLQWLKLYDRRPEYTIMVDKYAAKKWIADRIGEQYVIPTLGVWEHFDEIDFDAMPDQFALKCTHDSGSVLIVRDKTKMDKRAAKEKFESRLRKNFYWVCREWPYKDVPPRIIAEKYMINGLESELTDYKFFTFGGECKLVYVSKDHANDPKTAFFDENFNYLPLRMRDPNPAVPPEKPEKFLQMKDIACVLSAGIPHLRVDFYQVNGRLYVGELTFFHCGGFAPVKPATWGNKLGEWIKLPGC